MISVRLFSREEVKEKLDEFGCEFIEEMIVSDDLYYTASYWKTSWGFYFTVPQIGPDRQCPESRLYAILSELAELAPEG